MLRRIPRELLLILKTNDCLRSVDVALGAPINNLVVTARFAQGAVNAHRLALRPGLWTRLRCGLDTAALELRIAAFSAAVAAAAWLPRGWWRATPPAR